MKITEVVQEKVEVEMAESQNQRDKRVEELWRKLDPQGKGELGIKGLKKGLQKIDHPMKNADDMLQEIIKAVDTNRDGKIQYEEFRVFVEAAERQLLLLFRSIDRNHDGRVGRDELQSAFQKAGLAVPKSRLTGFFDEVDMNHDGYISFDEWREERGEMPTHLIRLVSVVENAELRPDSKSLFGLVNAIVFKTPKSEPAANTTGVISNFLLFMPQKHGSPLEAALSFYNSIVSLNAEGDSMVTEETLEGIGTTGSIFQALFGAILRLAEPPPPGTTPVPGSIPGAPSPSTPYPNPTTQQRQPPTSSELKPPLHPNGGERPAQMSDEAMAAAYSAYSQAFAGDAMHHAAEGTTKTARAMAACTYQRNSGSPELEEIYDQEAQLDPHEVELEDEVSSTGLTQYLPEPGYFVAGALAGGISRTATAPLDRLKVYLLVNTKAKTGAAIDAAKKGQGLSALRQAGKPIGDAIHDLYKAGGFRTFFAGNGLNVIKIMPETAIKFGTYEAAKRTLANLEGHGDSSRINPYSKFAAGGFAGMTAQFCVYPLDTLKFRLQCETVQGGPTGNALLVQTARKMIAEGGFRTAYRGITMGLVGMFPYSAIDMGTFEFLKKTFTRQKARYYGIHEEDASPGNIATGIIGATSGAFGATVVYPLNVLRTRLQTQGTVMHPPTYTGIWDVAFKTYQNEGMRGMYKGLTPNLLKVAPALSITWVVYENSKTFLGLH